MKITWNWLKEYFPTDFNPDMKEALQRLTAMGLEIESVSPAGLDTLIVAAKIISSAAHPSVSKLKVCQVFDGKETLTVVCGAPVVRVGSVAALAKPGAVVTGKKIEVRSVAGVDSFGMLCSEKELQIGEDASGLFYLEDSDFTLLGQSLNKILSLEDSVIEVGITPNRGDCLSVRGIARELNAAYGKRCSSRETLMPVSKEDPFLIQIEDRNACPFYGGALLSGVKVHPSPFWLRYRLHLVGLRPINNVVDITNFILWDIGQPMHAFDLKKIQSKGLWVRQAKTGEKIHTLDGQERKLSPEDLVIADSKGPVALAGVMGGTETAVDEKTDSVFFESASFHPTKIRKTARRLLLSSDSSYRFERGVDPENIPHSLLLASQMTQELAEGHSENTQINLKNFKTEPRSLPLRLDYCNKKLGITLQEKNLEEILSPLNIRKAGNGQWSVPSYRNDLNLETDLVEEVARVYGYDRIPENPEAVALSGEQESPMHVLKTRISDFLVGLGFCEAINHSFVAPQDLIAVPPFLKAPEKPETLANPLSPEQSVMRNALLPGLLRNAINSRNYKLKNVKLFEVGSVFPGFQNEKKDTVQWAHVALACAGEFPSSFVGTPERSLDFFDLKGILDALFQFLRITVRFEPLKSDLFQYGFLVDASLVIGVFGQLSEKAAKKWGGKESLICAELDLEAILASLPRGMNYTSPSRFPAIVEDMSFLADEKITHREIVSVIDAMSVPVLKLIQVFDIYKGKNIPAGKKSLAYSLTYSDPNQTLKMETVHQFHEMIKQELTAKLKVEFR